MLFPKLTHTFQFYTQVPVLYKHGQVKLLTYFNDNTHFCQSVNESGDEKKKTVTIKRGIATSL